MTPVQRHVAARYLHGLSQRRACRLLGLARNSYAEPVSGSRGGRPDDAAVVEALQTLVERQVGWAFGNTVTAYVRRA